MKRKITKYYEEPVDATEQGVEEEFSFDPVRAHQNILPGGVRKVRVELALDTDVVEFFKARESEVGAISCQTQINQALREAMARLQQVPVAQTSARKAA